VSALAIVLMVALGTLLIRASLVMLLANVAIPLRVEQALGLGTVAVLAGLVAQTLFLDAGDLRLDPSWFLAAAVAALVCWRTRSFGWTLLVGMASVLVLEGLL